MRNLVNCLEGILDADFDIDDSAILSEIIKKATGYKYEHELPTATIDGEWLVFDCSNRHRDIFIGSLVPLKQAGYSKYRFVNCSCVEFYYLYDGNSPSWSDFEVDAPESTVFFNGNTRSVSLTNIKINAHAVHIDADDSENMKIFMNGCKFDIAKFHVDAVTQLTISNTCKFTHCKLLYLGRIGKSVARKAFNLLMGDIRDGEAFKREVKYWQYADETKYWDIDPMKTLSLRANKWPDLGKIVLVPNGIPASTAPGICIYKPGKTMLPISKNPNGDVTEFKDGWKGQHVSTARTELNCVI